MCSVLTMLAEAATAEHHHHLQCNSSIPSHITKITFRMGPKKPTKSDVVDAAADAVLKISNLHKAETSNFKKPINLCSKGPNKSLGSAFEGSSSPIPSHIKKITFRVGPMKNVFDDEEALKSCDLAKTETSSSKKPIKVKGSASEGSSSSSNLHLPPKKKLKFNVNDLEDINNK
ncbi:hypothetical protein RIF29_18910 [Crotalaria pallida]|uniref:Uncharacterized protein n=1 Tax=Crotalaria pallida TaxID=3830 RepID=A0AAN9F6U1_CROPI